jgi:Bax protein
VERVLPLVVAENAVVSKQRGRMLKLLSRVAEGETPNEADACWLRRLADQYRVDADPLTDADARARPQRRVAAVPTDPALAQAAHERSWGRSRFAREGNNLFGIWTFDESAGVVPKRRAVGKTRLVRKFRELRHSVRAYLHTLNTHPAYLGLRKIRAKLRQQGEPLKGTLLAAGLKRYSARGAAYVASMRAMISDNEPERYNQLRAGAGGGLALLDG